MVTRTWPEPQHTKGEVRRAGKTLADEHARVDELLAARSIANAWRAAHQRPMQTLLVSLRRHAATVDEESQVFQRSKRMASIVSKLERGDVTNLADMQDLGGCRAVMSSVDGVREVGDRLRESRHKHRLVGEKDYLSAPKQSGYRGIHLVYSYRSDKNIAWNGLKVELQIRTRDQHAWATAVETVGLFSHQSLKSSQGDADWLEFFRAMSSFIALQEGLPVVLGMPESESELKLVIAALDSKLGALSRLHAYQATVREVVEGASGAEYFVLDLQVESPSLSRLVVHAFEIQREATVRYEELESHAIPEGRDVVLVRASELDALRRAYPNYFADTIRFRELVGQALAGATSRG